MFFVDDNGSKKSAKNRVRVGFTFSLHLEQSGYVGISSRFPKINFIEVVLLINPILFKMGFLLVFRKLDDDKRNI